MRKTPPELPVHIDASSDAWLCFTLQRSQDANGRVLDPRSWLDWTSTVFRSLIRFGSFDARRGVGAEEPTVERERWRAFTTQIAARFAAWIGDQHDTSALAAVLSETLASNPGVPVGVTWDGGIAITFADYRAAERRLAEALAQGAARPRWR